MKLLLRVMFMQGRLWHDRFPAVLERFQAPRGNNWICIGAGLAVTGAGAVSVPNHPIAGAAMTITGIGLFMAYSEPLISRLLRLDKTASISLSWAAGSVFLLLIPWTVVLALADGAWALGAYGS